MIENTRSTEGQNYQEASGVSEDVRVETKAVQGFFRTATTTVTQGEVTLRYAPQIPENRDTTHAIK